MCYSDDIEKSPENNDKKNSCTDFHGAAVIAQNGQEIAITDEMVDQAIDELMNDTAESD
ncbi:MAG: hypothetical protein KZQ70_14875 [gamma proteobacterium symbiont of Lucinoma myriamae]|nr:hypothetical protein [gamma proteobacterium symbiont of Lucinoma myriamae]MCU7819306.1 hypothetical protein [gamma proteobacterium symbiont of Lucinoma myriamae]